MTDKEKSEWKKSRRYAKYTYSVVRLPKQEVDKVNSCFFNEVTESLTFRTPERMIRAIRQWRKHIREFGREPNIFPPNVMPSYERRSFQEYLLSTLANLDVKHILRSPDHLDYLEKDLMRELNRTHVENPRMQTGQVTDKRNGCWEIEQSPQSKKLSWRRFGQSDPIV